MGILAAHAGVAGEPEIAQPIHHAEVDHLGDPPHIRRDVLRSDGIHLRSSATVDVLAALERLDQLLFSRDVGEHAQLHLRVIGADETLPFVSVESAPDPLPPLGAHWNVLQVGVRRRQAPGGRHGLVERRVHA
jgi:hypothetical protein